MDAPDIQGRSTAPLDVDLKSPETVISRAPVDRAASGRHGR